MERTGRSSAVYSSSSDVKTKSGMDGRVWVGRWGSKSARETHPTCADPTGGGRVAVVGAVVGVVVVVVVVVVVGGA